MIDMKKGITEVKSSKSFPVILIVVMLIGGLNITSSVGRNCGDFNNQSEPRIYTKENEILETHQNSVRKVSVTTNKYTYGIGELVEITLDGNWSAIYYEIGSVGYMIYDLHDNFIVEQFHTTILCPVGDPIEWWYGPETHYWNQTYKVYDEHTQNIYLDKWPHLISPSGEQVPSGKFNVFVSINGRVISEPAEFEIISTNLPPVADAGPNQTAVVGGFALTLLTFNGSGSYDPDGTIVSYFWDFGDGTNNSGEIVIHVYDTPGDYIAILTVTDDDGATDTDYAVVTVSKASVGGIFTDKYSYNIGEPINITYSGPHGPPTSYTPPGPPKYHFIIKNEYNETVVEEPLFGEICLTVCRQWGGTVSWFWNQAYRLYSGNRTVNDLIPPTGQQVPTGKYYVWFDTHYVWGLVGPAEFEIVGESEFKIEKEKISGPDEVYTHTYNEWELKITVSDYNHYNGYKNVIVYDVLPAELELLDYELTRGTLLAIIKGKGKMGSTHLTWNIGDLNGEAELILKIGTRKNPAGKQEFTSPGKYLLNEGASVEGIDSSTGKTINAGPTEPIFVTVLKN
jgi:PKD repeat protein